MTILLLSLIFLLVQDPAHGLVLPTFRIGLLTHLWDILIYHHSILLIALTRTLLDVRHRTTNFSILCHQARLKHGKEEGISGLRKRKS